MIADSHELAAAEVAEFSLLNLIVVRLGSVRKMKVVRIYSSLVRKQSETTKQGDIHKQCQLQIPRLSHRD